MPLLQLPKELLLSIVEHLDSDADINSLVQTNRYLYTTLNSFFYAHHIKTTQGAGLIRATERGNTAAARKLLDAGANVHVKQPVRRPCPATSDDPSANRPLLDCRCHSLAIARCASSGYPAVAVAVVYGRDEVFRLLAARFALEAPDVAHKCLDLALTYGREVPVKYLILDYGLRPRFKNGPSHTYVHTAASRGQADIVRLLANWSKADLGAALVAATSGGYADVVRVLVEEFKVNPSAVDYKGQTPLILAASCGYTAVVEILLAQDRVDVNFRDSRGHTALFAAVKSSHHAVADLIRKRLPSASLGSCKGYLPPNWSGKPCLCTSATDAKGTVSSVE